VKSISIKHAERRSGDGARKAAELTSGDLAGRQKSAEGIVCAEQRVIQEGSSPSSDRMRVTVSKSGGNASLAEEMVFFGGQGVRRETESEGHEEKYRAVIDGGYLDDEPVGQRRGKVEPAVWRRRRSHSLAAPRCLRTARYGRKARDLRRTVEVADWQSA